MDTRWHSYMPGTDSQLPHDPVKAIVAPRPIAWVSSLSATGSANLAPYSFFTLLSSHPLVLGFSSEGEKDTLTNIRRTGEFVVNIAGEALAVDLVKSGFAYPADVSEFDALGLEKVPSLLIAPPRVARAVAAFECRLANIIAVTDAKGRATVHSLVMGEVVQVHIDQKYLIVGHFDSAGARLLGRGGYRDEYAVLNELTHLAL